MYCSVFKDHIIFIFENNPKGATNDRNINIYFYKIAKIFINVNVSKVLQKNYKSSLKNL